MKTNTFYLPSSNGINKLRCIMWIPETDIRGIVQISHGMQEHIGRYKSFASFLTLHGYVVIGHDHVGHGYSVNSKDNYGFFSPNTKDGRCISSALAVKDLYHVTRYVKAKYPNKPCYLLGHSMGSLLVRRYLMTKPDYVDGAILLGTGNLDTVSLTFGTTLLELLTKMYGEHHISPLVKKLLFGSYNKMIKHPRTSIDWICTDPKVVHKYQNDSMCGFDFTLNGYNLLISTMEYILNPKNIRRLSKNTPIYLTSGLLDPVGHYGNDIPDIYISYQNAGVKDITIKLYPHCRHEILNEKNHKEVYANILRWIECHQS